MSNRLNQEREKILQPKRMSECLGKLESIGIKVDYFDDVRIDFMHKGHKVQFYPYSGWHSSRG